MRTVLCRATVRTTVRGLSWAFPAALASPSFALGLAKTRATLAFAFAFAALAFAFAFSFSPGGIGRVIPVLVFFVGFGAAWGVLGLRVLCPTVRARFLVLVFELGVIFSDSQGEDIASFEVAERRI